MPIDQHIVNGQLARTARHRGVDMLLDAWLDTPADKRAAMALATGDLPLAAGCGGGWQRLAERDFLAALGIARNGPTAGTRPMRLLEAEALIEAGGIVAGLQRLEPLHVAGDPAATAAFARHRHRLGDHRGAEAAARALPMHTATALVGARAALVRDNPASAFAFLEPFLTGSAPLPDSMAAGAVAVLAASSMVRGGLDRRLKRFAERLVNAPSLPDEMMPTVARVAWIAGMAATAWERFSGDAPWMAAARLELAVLAGDAELAARLTASAGPMGAPSAASVMLLRGGDGGPSQSGLAERAFASGATVHVWRTHPHRWQPWIDAALRTEAEVGVFDLAQRPIAGVRRHSASPSSTMAHFWACWNRFRRRRASARTGRSGSRAPFAGVSPSTGIGPPEETQYDTRDGAAGSAPGRRRRACDRRRRRIRKRARGPPDGRGRSAGRSVLGRTVAGTGLAVVARRPRRCSRGLGGRGQAYRRGGRLADRTGGLTRMQYRDPLGAHRNAGIPVSGHSWSGQRIAGEDVAGVIYHDCSFERVHFAEMNFTKTMFLNSRFEDCVLEGCAINETIWNECSGNRLRIVGGTLTGGVFAAAGIGRIEIVQSGERVAFSDCSLDTLAFEGDGRSQLYLTVAGCEIGEVLAESAAWRGASAVDADLGVWRMDNAAFTNCSFIRARGAEADFSKVRFESCNLYRSAFEGARIRWAERSIFAECALAGADFREASLKGAMFAKAEANGAAFEGAQLDGALFPQAKLANARFAGASAVMSVWTEADLTGANLESVQAFQSTFRNANLRDATVTNASFVEADLHGVEETLAGADLRGSRGTIGWRAELEARARSAPG